MSTYKEHWTRGGILIYPCPSIRPSGYRYMVCPAISSYSFGAAALIFCRMFIHIMEVCMSTGFWFLKLEKKYAPALDNYGQSCFVRSDLKKMKCVWPSKSCGHAHLHYVMFIHIMEVCMSTGFWFSSNILKMTGSWT
jgi:hypothetical protein